MSLIFDDAISRGAMPKLSFQEITQNWLKNYFLQEPPTEGQSDSQLFRNFPSLLEYQTFIKHYVKVNLNHFAGSFFFNRFNMKK